MLVPSRNGKLILSCVLAFAVGMSGSCSDGWTPSPSNAAWGSACYKSVGPATTIGECNELCGVGAAPVCIESEEELNFLTSSDVTGGWPHFTGHYDGDKCISAPAGGKLVTFANTPGTGPIQLAAAGRNSWPWYSHSMYSDMWIGTDMYELLECNFIASRFVRACTAFEGALLPTRTASASV